MTLDEFATRQGLLPVIHRAISYAPSQLGLALLACPVDWSARLVKSAGYFHSRPMAITLHPDLQRQGQQAVVDTLLHETAHAIQFLRYGVVDHGATWWEAMHQLGAKPERCHNMKLRAASRVTSKRPEDLDL